MKLLWILALILNLTGYGEIPAEGLDTLVTETEIDALSGKERMLLEGMLLAEGPLTVTVTRSQTELSDEFCCAGSCTAGNGQTSETLSFTPSGVTSWYVHYNPAPGSDVSISYLFSDDAGSLELRVQYVHNAEGIHRTDAHTKAVKVLRHGQVQIRRAETVFNLQGTKIEK